MKRRRALQIVGATLPVTGCVTTPDTDSGPAQSEADTPAENSAYELGDEASVDGLGPVTVESVTLQRSLIHHHLHRELYEPADAQLLVLHGEVPDDVDPEFDIQFGARLDGDIVNSAAQTWLNTETRIYALSVPVDTVDDTAVQLQRGERPTWSLPETVTEKVSVAPEFALRGAEISDRADRTVLKLTVENHGSRDGVFRGVAEHSSAADADAAIRFPVPAGDTVTETLNSPIVDSWSADAEFAHEISERTRVFAVG